MDADLMTVLVLAAGCILTPIILWIGVGLRRRKHHSGEK